MPSSYQAPTRADKQKKKEHRTVSQSQRSNMSVSSSTVQKLLDTKGTDIFSIQPQDTLAQAVNALSEKRIGALVVTDEHGKLTGILSERDIVRKLAVTPGRTLPQRVEEVMTSKVQTCDPDEPLMTVLRRMTEGRFRHMPVVAHGELVGMVTIGDVVHFRLKELELEALQLKQMIVG
ncbi:MAG: CBS domain-containing protein [Pseudomonadota bacterium]